MIKKGFLFVTAILVIACCACNKMPKQEQEELGETVKEGFVMHSCLQDDMVLQRNADFVLWGKASAGVKVFARPSWKDERYEGTAGADGIWEVKVPVPDVIKDNAAQSLKVYNSTTEFNLKNLLIGDVWILGGQSNMGITLSQSENGASEIAAADQPLMRYYLCHQAGKNEPIFDWDSFPTGGHDWVSVSPSNADWVSAIGYYFAKYYIEKTGVPVGMINTSMGGMPIKSYIPKDDFNNDPELVKHFPGPDPGRLYNSMVYPVSHFSAMGFLWYQGEADWGTWAHYAHAQKVLIDAWRASMNVPQNAPFYLVQLAPYADNNDVEVERIFYQSGRYEGYPMMREAQASVRDLCPNVEMAVIMDVGDLANIHPEKKQPVGERLARIALNKDLGMSDVEYKGPVLSSMSLSSGVLKLSFANASGLRTRDGGAPVHFYVSRGDQKYHKTTAEIRGEEVWLTDADGVLSSAASVSEITVRYAFLYAAMTNLENGAGLPAEPFRTDTWDTVEYVY